MNRSAVNMTRQATYPGCKPSGVPWLGDIPKHWEVRRLKYTADLINMKVDGSDNDLAYTGLEHIESWTGKRIAPNGEATSEGQANLYRGGDVLFGKLRPYLAKAYAADSDGVCSGELLVLRPRALLQAFLLDYVLNPDFVAIVDSSTYGAKMPRANWDFIGNLPALIPPKEEQRAVAAFLDRETARIDALIEKKRRQIEILQEKRSALISHAVTKGLDPKAKMKDSGVEWLGEIPEHWESIRLKFLGNAIIGLTYSPRDVTEAGNGTLVLRASNIQGSRIVLNDNVYVTTPIPEKLRTRAGDILICSRNGSQKLVGKSGYISSEEAGLTFGAFTTVFRSPHNDYLYYLFNSGLITQQAGLYQTSTIFQLTTGILNEFRVAFPPEGEQHAIADYLDVQTTRFDSLIRKVIKSIDFLREYRTAVISAAVTGKIDVCKETA